MNIRLAKTAAMEKENARLKREVSLLETHLLQESQNSQVMRLQLEQTRHALGRHRETARGTASSSQAASSKAPSSLPTPTVLTPREGLCRPWGKTATRGGGSATPPSSSNSLAEGLRRPPVRTPPRNGGLTPPSSPSSLARFLPPSQDVPTP